MELDFGGLAGGLGEEKWLLQPVLVERTVEETMYRINNFNYTDC